MNIKQLNFWISLALAALPALPISLALPKKICPLVNPAQTRLQRAQSVF